MILSFTARFGETKNGIYTIRNMSSFSDIVISFIYII